MVTGKPITSAVNRRTVLTLAAAGAVAAALPLAPARAQRLATKARIVIAGAGAAGISAAARLTQVLDGASITLLDARKEHYYQPGFTLVAAGLKPASYTVASTRDLVPDGATLIEERVVEFDPVGNKVTTHTGRALPYDFLIVAAGIELDYGAIAGMDMRLIGRDGIGSVFAGPNAAAETWREMSRFADQGGVGLFGRPATEMKCAGAPLKYTFITDDYLRRRGNRGRAEIVYAAPGKALFSVPIVAEKVRMLYQDRGVDVRYDHVLTAIDPGGRRATFKTPTGTEEIRYDFINVIPPMRAAGAVRRSPLAWLSGPFSADGWMEVDKASLRHRRFDNVFGVGDVAGVPKGKTAASVKWQVPVAVDHLVGSISGKPSTMAYNGYTSCPLITRLGRAMLVEFDYDNNLLPSFPGVIAPLEELWITWVMKEVALKATYYSMLHGQA